MFQEAISKVTNSIFPIFYQFEVKGQIGTAIAGTGFFIDDEGYFMTADHVIALLPAKARIYYPGNVPDAPLPKLIEIEKIHSNPEKDIFIGRVSDEQLAPLTFADSEARIGQSVSLCGYPMPRLTRNTTGVLDVSNVRKYWQATHLIDILGLNDGTRDCIGFITQDTSLSGMSGGPVFDVDGAVIGMNIVKSTREITDINGETMKVRNAFAVNIKDLKDNLALAKGKTEKESLKVSDIQPVEEKTTEKKAA